MNTMKKPEALNSAVPLARLVGQEFSIVEDLRLNHEYCPKEVILAAADEIERLREWVEEALSYVGCPSWSPSLEEEGKAILANVPNEQK